MHHRLASLALVIAASLAVACGGKTTDADFNAADTGSPAAETGGEAGGETGGGADAVAVDAERPKPTAETCKKFLAATCNEKTEACCTSAGLGWTAGACNANLDYYCNALVDQVTLGRATYDATYEDACLKGWAESLSVCRMDGLTSARYQIPCSQWFNGLKKPGETCTGKSFTECEAPKNMGAYCDVKPGEMMGRCRAYGFVGKDQGCNFVGSTVRYCDAGLYCDMTSPTAVCKDAKPIGAACEGADDYSCGWNVCKDKKCTARLPEGSACTTGNDCLSYGCGSDGKCTKLGAAVSAWMCTGGM